MQRTISSTWTFFEKFIVPAMWLIGWGLGTFALYFANHRDDGRSANSILEFRRIYLGFGLLASGLVYWFCVRLKRVSIDSTTLYVSNYLKEVQVPLRDIAQVTENRWVNSHPVTIEFQCDTEFGRSILFMPPIRILGGWRPHPVVEELREAARHAASV